MSEGFEIARTLVVSSAHLKSEIYTKLINMSGRKTNKIIWDDITLLEKHLCSGEYRYGWRIFCLDRTEEEYIDLGFSNGFVKIMVLAKALGVDRVEFDQDGSVIDEIPIYDIGEIVLEPKCNNVME